jgi:hypothetical protein
VYGAERGGELTYSLPGGPLPLDPVLPPPPVPPIPKPPAPGGPPLEGWQQMLSPVLPGQGGPGTAARTDTGAGGTVDASRANSLFGHNDIQHDLNTLRQQLVAIGPAAYTAEGKQQILTLLQAFLDAAGTRLQTSDANVQAEVAKIQRFVNELNGKRPPARPPAPPEPPKPPPSPEDSARRYNDTQRAADQALVDRAHAAGRDSYLPSMSGRPGYMTEEEAAAAARLRDYNTITNPNSHIAIHGGQDARNLAGERLNDYNQSRFIGPLTMDRVTGLDARQRALMRMRLQHDLENGNLSWHQQPMVPDDATRLLDQREANGRVNIIESLKDELERLGLSPGAANQVAESYEHGLVPPFEHLDAIEAAGKPFTAGERAMDNASDLLDHGRHWQPDVNAYTLEDIDILKRTAKRLGYVGTAVDLGTAVYELLEGKEPGEVLAKAVGGWAGALALGELGAYGGAYVGGPYGAFFGALILGTIGGLGGDAAGKEVYQWLTR